MCNRIDEKTARVKKTLRKFLRNEKLKFSDLGFCINTHELNSIEPTEFLNIRNRSVNLIDAVLSSAVDNVNSDKRYNRFNISQYVYNAMNETNNKATYTWPTIDEFKYYNYKQLVQRYIQLWNLNPLFQYHVKLLDSYERDLSTYHCSEVIFSIPLPHCPCPQATASVFFTIEIPQVVPKTCPVNVTYKFEGFDSVQNADNRWSFQQELLRTILHCKLKIYSKLNF